MSRRVDRAIIKELRKWMEDKEVYVGSKLYWIDYFDVLKSNLSPEPLHLVLPGVKTTTKRRERRSTESRSSKKSLESLKRMRSEDEFIVPSAKVPLDPVRHSTRQGRGQKRVSDDYIY